MVRKLSCHQMGWVVNLRPLNFSCYPVSSIQLAKYGLFICALLPALSFAQIAKPLEKAPPDSLRRSIVDTSKSSRADSLHRFVSRKGFVDTTAAPKFFLPNTSFRMDTAATSTQFFQDFIHLASQTVPMVPILAGEVGQPRYWAAGDLPPRAVEIFVDDIRWIPGVYGTVDLTSLPDAHVQRLDSGAPSLRAALPATSPYVVHLASDSLNFNVPFSRLEYAKGPFGADAVRIQLGRALGKRLAAYLNGAFCNSEGQFVNRPYEGHKANLQLDYFLTPQWKLRYHQLNSRNAAGLGVPFFPEEWPGIINASHKEERLYHALELSSRQGLQLRSFFWQVKEELSDPARRHLHRLRDGGAELNWKKQTETWALNIEGNLGLEAINSTSIHRQERFYEQFLATFGRRLTPRTWLQWRGHLRYKNDWPSDAALQAQIIMQRNPLWTWWVSGSLSKIAPALGERDNALEYLARNTDLQAANLWRGEWGFLWQRRRFNLHFQLSGALWKNGLIFQPDSVFLPSGSLRNKSGNTFVLATQLKANWQFAAKWHFAAVSTQTANAPQKDFWFWHQPDGYSRVSLETIRAFFGGDLEILPRIAGRFIGKRYSRFDTTSTGGLQLRERELPAAVVLDLQIRLRHGDGALIFSWENFLNQTFDWRPGVPAVGRYLRWGFWWNFLN